VQISINGLPLKISIFPLFGGWGWLLSHPHHKKEPWSGTQDRGSFLLFKCKLRHSFSGEFLFACAGGPACIAHLGWWAGVGWWAWVWVPMGELGPSRCQQLQAAGKMMWN